MQGELVTILVGLIGFAGVILTLIVNNRLASKERKAVLDHECDGMKVALLAELQTNLTALIEGFKEIDKALKENKNLLVPTESISAVYRAFLPRIGLMSDLVPTLMDTYLLLEEMPKKVLLLRDSEVVNQHVVQVQHGMLRILKSMMNDAAKNVGSTIEALGGPAILSSAED